MSFNGYMSFTYSYQNIIVVYFRLVQISAMPSQATVYEILHLNATQNELMM